MRTKLQHQWALLSEAIADVFGQNLKYGVGEEVALTVLFGSANTFWKFDQLGSLMGKISSDPVAKDD